MKRPVTEDCAVKKCPHLSWEIYLKGRRKEVARRRICTISGFMPSYLDKCPMEKSRSVS